MLTLKLFFSLISVMLEYFVMPFATFVTLCS